MNVDPPVLVCVEATEGVGQTLELNAKLDEVVEVDHSSACFVVFFEKEAYALIGESVAKSDECLLEFVEVDMAGIVSIKSPKAMLPIRDIFPQAGKFVKPDRTSVVLVEHHYHQSDGFGVKRGPRSI